MTFAPAPPRRAAARPTARTTAALTAAFALAAALLTLQAPGSRAAEADWTRVGTGILQGVSGVAANPRGGGWVIVRDNKEAGQNRVALLSTSGTVTPLTWPGSAPSDIEAIAGVPGQPRRYAVVTSGGAGRIVEIDGTSLKVLRSFTLPTGRNQNEAFAIAAFGSTKVAVWGNRGSSSTPGKLFAATFNVGKGTFGRSVTANVTVPVPTRNVRHVSDAALLGGSVVVSSASDPGNNGPFESSLHRVGTVSLVSGRARLTVGTPRLLATYAGHKIEAIACAGTSGIMGTDDENLGGFVAPATFC